MKKFLAWLGTAALLASLCGCKSTPKQGEDKQKTAIPTNDTEYTFQAAEDAEPLPGGAAITLITGPEGVEEGADAALWQGISAFAYNFGYVPKNEAAASTSAEDLQSALKQAAESGSKVVICRGDAMAQAVYELQGKYPDTYFMVVDAEAHNADYSDYTVKDTVRCVLFSETQVGYLAGYAAVSEGYEELGFAGAEEMPATVRYCTGFMQGAEKAAEQQGDEITLQVWYSGSKEYSDAVAERLASWYNNGTQVILQRTRRRCRRPWRARNKPRPRAKSLRSSGITTHRTRRFCSALCTATTLWCSRNCIISLRRAGNGPKTRNSPATPIPWA